MNCSFEKKLKIALVGYTLADGGLEKMLSAISHLFDENGVAVHLILLENKIAYTYSGKLYNLGYYSKFLKYFKLYSILKNNQYDYIIDFRYRLNPLMEFLFLNFIYRKSKVVYTVHSSKLEHYFTPNSIVAKQIFKKAFAIVTVSEKIKYNIEKYYAFEKAQVIYNFIDFKKIHLLGEEKMADVPEVSYVIAVGRLVALKQFDKLLKSYSHSILPNNNIHLLILGDGPEKSQLEVIAENLNIANKVHFLGFKNNPFQYIKRALFLVLCSEYEGFGLVLVESLCVETPVVSFDCDSGPSEIIEDNYNGLLVKNQDFTELTTKMNKFVNDKELYKNCKSNAMVSVTRFNKDEIFKNWLNLLQ